MELRDYQQQGIADIRQAFRTHRRVLYQLPTGGGKTTMFTHMALAHLARAPEGYVDVYVHRQELMEQIVGAFRKAGARVATLPSIEGSDPRSRTLVGSVFTVARRLSELRRPTFAIVDEAHHAAAGTTWGQILAQLGDTPVLGVTATPCRLDGRGLDDCFDTLVCGPSTQQLIEAGWLARPSVYAPAVVNVEAARAQAGEFVTKDLERILDASTITGDAVAAYQKYAPGQRFICFGVSRRHIATVAEGFRSAGLPVQSIDGLASPAERKRIIGEFRSGALLGLVSCQLVDEGFDVPEIGCGIDLAPTRSVARYLQRAGRCLRTTAAKRSVVLLDLAGNALRHGLPDRSREWHLTGRAPAAAVGRRTAAAVRICDFCFAATPSIATACQVCGAAFATQHRIIETRAGYLELHDADKAALAAAQIAAHEKARSEQMNTQGYKALVELGKRRGMAHPHQWAWHVHRARMAKKHRRVRI